MLLWLGELVVASFILTRGAEGLSKKYGGVFVGRTFMSIATTLPEIAIVIYASANGFYGAAIGAGLGSNLLMMTLGLALMLLIATTRLSRAPLKGIDVSAFGLDKLFLIVTAIASAALFINGYDLTDGVVFLALFLLYLLLAYRAMRTARGPKHSPEEGDRAGTVSQESASRSQKEESESILRAAVVFFVGAVGIFIGAQPFIEALEGFSVDTGMSVVVLAVIISPIAGEMPEKLSMMILARKGAAGASIAVANVLGSKILNNTLLLAVAVFGAVSHGGISTIIGPTQLLLYQMALVTTVTILALTPMFRRKIGLKAGILLATMYVVCILLQFVLPGDHGTS